MNGNMIYDTNKNKNKTNKQTNSTKQNFKTKQKLQQKKKNILPKINQHNCQMCHIWTINW